MNIWSPDETGKRVYILGGERGTGKSELALNLALRFKEKYKIRIDLLDLDSQKAAFRSRDFQTGLKQIGINFLVTAVSSLDIPVISPEISGVLRENKTENSPLAVIDLAGEPEGARILGAYQDFLGKAYEFWLVFNASRPFAQDFKQLLRWSKEIEAAVRLPFTGLVNNSHLMGKTNKIDLIESAEKARQLAQALKIPLVFHAVSEEMLEKGVELSEPVFPLKLLVKPPWESLSQ